MVWRPMPAEQRRAGPAAKKQALARLVESATPIGLIGYLGDEPVAWCSVAPVATYRNFRAGIKSPGEPGVWSLACMWVKRPLRGRGVTEDLIKAAAAYAREYGATALEAYPVDPDAPGYRFMGFVPTFLRLGFEDLGMAGARRHVMRLQLD